MKISVIISTYNSPKWLEKVLWGYECQTAKDFEIVIADDGSREETRALLDRYTKSSKFSLKHVWHEDDDFGKWQIVNKAIEAASGDYLIFTDGDCIPHPGLVQVHLDHAERGKYLSGGYCKLPIGTSGAISWEDIHSGRIFTIKWLKANGFGFTPKWLKVIAPGKAWSGILNRLTPAAKTFNGNNSSCFRTDALTVGGFDERIRYGGGDREFGYRLEHSGIAPKIIRYSTVALHLDHPRGYKDEAVRAANMKIIDETIKTGRVRTEFGISG